MSEAVNVTAGRDLDKRRSTACCPNLAAGSKTVRCATNGALSLYTYGITSERQESDDAEGPFAE